MYLQYPVCCGFKGSSDLDVGDDTNGPGLYKAAPHVQVPRAQESELDFFTLTDPSYDVLEPIQSG